MVRISLSHFLIIRYRKIHSIGDLQAPETTINKGGRGSLLCLPSHLRSNNDNMGTGSPLE